jgi:DNA-binding NarL/FixJ family response regulator
MPKLLRQLLIRTLERAPGVEVRCVHGDAETVLRAVARLEPDWVILDMDAVAAVEELVALFDARPRVKLVALADHGARGIVCVQLGELDPSSLLQALERIDRTAVLDASG